MSRRQSKGSRPYKAVAAGRNFIVDEKPAKLNKLLDPVQIPMIWNAMILMRPRSDVVTKVIPVALYTKTADRNC